MWWSKVFACGTNNILLNNKFLGNVKNYPGIIISQHQSRNYSEVENTNESVDCLSRFERLIRDRRRQVKKSVLIHVFNKFVIGNLINYTHQYGNVSRFTYYKVSNEKVNDDKAFVLLEFESEKAAEQLISDTVHFRKQNVVPVSSKCLWFEDKVFDSKPPGLMHHAEVPTAEIMKALRCADSVSDQMMKLHENLKLSEVGQLLRFFVCHQLEMAISGLFPNCSILPFGSTVNGFGKFHCDLDMALSLKDEISARSANENDDRNWFYFHTKRAISNDRRSSQKNLEFMADLIAGFLPGGSNVQRILHARVPIVKFRHDLVNIECDLSMSNLSGVYMSELLYLLGEFDDRLNLLAFSVLYWAKEVGLTQHSPGKWITNFSLILMTVFFLQTRPNPVLPSLDQLQTMAENRDMRITDGINCTFLRDISKFPKMENKEPIDELLIEFFKFYTNFDYQRDGISIVKGTKMSKADHSSLYIENPLETDLNVSKNVSGLELERICQRMKNSLWILEGSMSKRDTNWGLLSLFDVVEKPQPLERFPLKNLFENDDDESETVVQNVRKSDRNTTNDSKKNEIKFEEENDSVNKPLETQQRLQTISLKDENKSEKVFQNVDVRQSNRNAKKGSKKNKMEDEDDLVSKLKLNANNRTNKLVRWKNSKGRSSPSWTF